ncbi:response regulator [Leptospira sp. 2 VSF19]|uniref:Response regulator n=1 Tax=Leptospira soteropolitanensis TaxID=2950025 RepID=A0AAW5VCA9_9LEPT|nr:response regulator [Leptospira soteropolitanensis]MCW7491281.1 response regulator [Leptospira soteropolitanensis]MCW7498866.1 response regulator [Leptospira soteropolitanensis]MCW7521542.1 response regulator [Leptospira soteropolitanensis]MCW7524969.1 response regulator [Leptospira soteropolitanensis]MCW7528837.1 response regulator [Leptospira soteropolitanensis]
MKILFVDDEDTIRELFWEYFKDEFNVTMASDGLEALTITNQNTFDLIISDISLPKLNGIQFIQKLRAEGNQTPFLVITGDSDIQIAIDVFRMGAVDFFLKPFRMEALRSRIKKFENADIDLTLLFNSGEITQFSSDCKIKLKPQIKKLNSYIAFIVKQILNSPLATHEDLISIKIVLYELLANAIEHGVAGVSYVEKQECLEANEDYFKLVDSRCAENNSSVFVEISMDDVGVTIVIRDEGNGFAVSQIPNPIVNPAANLVSGRGIFLAKMNIDSIVYNEKGNEVRFFKTWYKLMQTN